MNPFPRASGVLMHPTSLPGRYGIGDFGSSACRFIDLLAESGQAYWQVLPLGPTGYADSPYQCLSSFAGNPNLICLDDLKDCGWLREGDFVDLPHFRTRRVDFGVVNEWHDEMLHLAYERFLLEEAPYDFLRWCDRPEQASWLADYALYRSLKERHNEKSWVEWPQRDAFYSKAQFQHADRHLRARMREHQFRQWVFFDQWRKLREYAAQKSIRIIGDLPFYVGHDSCDVWANRSLFDLDADGKLNTVAGVPPDSFSPSGQRWGNPIYLWDRHTENGFQWWRERIQSTLRMVDFVRIDHFRAFDRYWQIPGEDGTAERGIWRSGPKDEFFERLPASLLTRLIAEDLGDDMKDAIELRRRHGLPGMVVVQFALSGSAEERDRFDPRYGDNSDCFVYTGTHDNHTATAWWYLEASDRERAELVRLCDLKPAPRDEEVGTPAWRMIWLGMCYGAHSFVTPLQDLMGLGDSGRMNRPSTTSNNWTWRCATADMEGVDWARLRELTAATGRLNSPKQLPSIE